MEQPSGQCLTDGWLFGAEDQDDAQGEEEGGKAEGGTDAEGGPERAHNEAGKEVADGVYRGEGAESHAVLFAGDDFGGYGIFESLFGADVEAGEGGDEAQQPKRVGAGAEQERGDDSEGITGGEDGAAMRDVVADPTAGIGGGGVEDVVDGVKDDGEAGGAGHAVRGRQHAGGVEDEQGVGEIAGAEDAYRDEEAAEGGGEGLQSGEEGLFLRSDEGAFADQEPETSDGGHAGHKRVEENLAVVVIRDLQEPQSGERPENGAEGVHETLEAEGAAVSSGGNVGGEQGLFRWRADPAAEPRG